MFDGLIAVNLSDALFMFKRKGSIVMAEMTKIEIITRQSKLEDLKTALNEIGINGMTVSNVLGYGVQKGQKHRYRGVEYSVDLLPKIKIEMVVCTVPVDDVVNTAISVLRTGEIGDGKIFISPVSRVIKVRTGEEDREALLSGGIKYVKQWRYRIYDNCGNVCVFDDTGIGIFLWRSCTKKKCAQYNDDVSSIYGTFIGIVGTLRIFAFIQR